MTTEMQKQAAWVSEIYAAVAKGGTLQVWHSDTEEWRDASNGPNLTCREDWWRIKPKPRSVWIIPSEITGGDANAEMRRVYYSEDAAPFGAVEYREVLP